MRLICGNIWKRCCVCWNFRIWSDAFRLWISFDFFQKTFFPKFELLNSGCGLSVGAAYLQMRLICRSLRYQSSFKKKKKTLSDKGLTLIMSAFKTCYGGQFTWSTQLMKSNYLVSHPTNAAPQVLQECTSIIIIFIYLLAYYLHTIFHSSMSWCYSFFTTIQVFSCKKIL